MLKTTDNIMVLHDQPMSCLTTFRIGGRARTMLLPHNVTGLEECLKHLAGTGKDFYCLGKGSNLLVSDQGVETVLSLERLCQVDILEKRDEVIISAGAGTSLRQLVAICARRGISGLETLAGIPASVGGAVFMNAGASGVSFSAFLQEVLVVSPRGSGWIPANELDTGYRNGGLPQGAVAAWVKLKLKKDTPQDVRKRATGILKKRALSQPVGAASAGCVFRNFHDAPAGKIIDRCGLKGVRRGGAMVSPVHANFIVNTGDATCSDVLELIDVVTGRVKDQTGRTLKLELRVWH